MQKVALITGASKGIGKSLSETFAKNGYSLILVARNEDDLNKVSDDLKNRFKCETKVVAADISNSAGIDQLMAAINDELPNLEVLVNNAGYGKFEKFMDTENKDITGMIDLNVTSLTDLTHKILPHMLKNKSGKILNVASTAAYQPGPNCAVYYATKAYVLSLSEALHEEFKKSGINITALCPGVTKTAFFERAGNSELSTKVPGMTSEAVAQIGYDALMKNKRVAISGGMNNFLAILTNITPNFILLKMVGYLNSAKK